MSVGRLMLGDYALTDVPQEFRAQSTLDLCATVEISQPCDCWISRFIEISYATRYAPWG